MEGTEKIAEDIENSPEVKQVAEDMTEDRTEEKQAVEDRTEDRTEEKQIAEDMTEDRTEGKQAAENMAEGTGVAVVKGTEVIDKKAGYTGALFGRNIEGIDRRKNTVDMTELLVWYKVAGFGG